MHPLRNPAIRMIWLIMLSIPGSVRGATEDIVGNWMGTLHSPGSELRIAFTIELNQDGA